MLGYVLGLTLVLAVLTPLVFVDVFADSFSVTFDKEFYDLGDSVTISGEIFDLRMPVIAISIYDPDGKILSANNLEITSDQTFSKTISLDFPFYEKTGQYLVKLDYGQTSENYSFTIQADFSEPEILIEENTSPEILLLYTEQKQYTDKDVIIITGLVSAMDSPTALIGIYDTFGMPAGFYFGSIDSNLEFTTSFLVKDGVNFRVDGTYSVKAYYGESEAISFFEYSKVPQIIIEDIVTEDIVTEINYEIKKSNNLTVEDVELGKLLNQIALECDSSAYTDIISYYDGMGPALYRLCKFDSSLNFFNESLIANPNDVEVLVNKGSALGKLGYFSEAIVFYDHALKIDPSFLSAKNNKANALANLGYFDDAILLYNQILNQNPNYLTAAKNLDIATSSISDLSSNSFDSNIENISYSESPSEQTNSKKQNFANFFDGVGIVFSTLGSIFDFLN